MNSKIKEYRKIHVAESLPTPEQLSIMDDGDLWVIAGDPYYIEWADEHNDGELDLSRFTLITANNGTVTEEDGLLKLVAVTSGGEDAAAVKYNNVIDFAKKQKFKIKAMVKDSGQWSEYLSCYVLSLIRKNSLTTTTYTNGGRCINIAARRQSGAGIFITRVTANGTAQYWNAETEEWATSTSPGIYIIQHPVEYIIFYAELETDVEVNMVRVAMYDESHALLTRTSWCNAFELGGDINLGEELNIVIGNPYTDTVYRNILHVESSYYRRG